MSKSKAPVQTRHKDNVKQTVHADEGKFAKPQADSVAGGAQPPAGPRLSEDKGDAAKAHAQTGPAAKKKGAPTPRMQPTGREVREDRGDHAKPHAEKLAEAAYFKAQQRAFEPGHELEDWLAAEAELGPDPSRR